MFNIQMRCDECSFKLDQQRIREIDAQRAARKERHWKRICPPQYRATDPQDPRLDPICLATTERWRIDEANPKGIGLVGRTGLGKTRCLYLALHRVFDEGYSVMAVSHAAHAEAATAAAGGASEAIRQDEARSLLKRCMAADVLLLDDIGKPRMTPTRVEAMEVLIETRTSKDRPILWSANSGSDWLIEYFGGDSGKAITRRLAEFSEIPVLPR